MLLVPRASLFSKQRHNDLPENEYVISSSSSPWCMPIKDDCSSSFPFLTFIFFPHSRSLFSHPVTLISPLFLSLSLFSLKRFSYLNILSVCILFLHSLPSLFSPTFLWLPFYLSVLPSFLYSYLGNSKRYLQFRFY